MENRGKRVKIVGKGHAFCFERELFNWYRRESFVDVFLTCIGSPDDYIKDGRSLRQISANRRLAFDGTFHLTFSLSKNRCYYPFILVFWLRPVLSLPLCFAITRLLKKTFKSHLSDILIVRFERSLNTFTRDPSCILVAIR